MASPGEPPPSITPTTTPTEGQKTSRASGTRPSSSSAKADPPPELFGDLPPKGLRPEQVAGELADWFVGEVPLASRPGTFQLIIRALKVQAPDRTAPRYTEDQVRAAVTKVAGAGDHLNRYNLYAALEGRQNGDGRGNGSSYQPYREPPQDAYRRRPRAAR